MLLELRELGVRAAFGRESGREPLGGGAEEVEVLHALLGHLGDGGATVRRVADRAFGLEQPQGLADRCRADAVPLGEIGLTESLARVG
jgi:hypothetical protein